MPKSPESHDIFHLISVYFLKQCKTDKKEMILNLKIINKKTTSSWTLTLSYMQLKSMNWLSGARTLKWSWIGERLVRILFLVSPSLFPTSGSDIGELKQLWRRRLQKRLLKKWSRAVSNFVALLPTLLICQMLTIFFWSWILKDCIFPKKK